MKKIIVLILRVKCGRNFLPGRIWKRGLGLNWEVDLGALLFIRRPRSRWETLPYSDCFHLSSSAGINSLIANNVYEAAYPLHDVSTTSTSQKVEPCRQCSNEYTGRREPWHWTTLAGSLSRVKDSNPQLDICQLPQTVSRKVNIFVWASSTLPALILGKVWEAGYSVKRDGEGGCREASPRLWWYTACTVRASHDREWYVILCM